MKASCVAFAFALLVSGAIGQDATPASTPPAPILGAPVPPPPTPLLGAPVPPPPIAGAPPSPPPPGPVAPPPVVPPTTATPTPRPPAPAPTPAPTTKPPGPAPATPAPTPTTTASRTPPTPGSTPSPATPSNNAATTGGSSSSSSGSGSSGGSGGSGYTDADILYFAYNLEIFEAQFYSCAAFGTPVASQYLGGGPSPSCRKANLTSFTGSIAAELAREEAAHVALLYQALTAAGVKPVAPTVNIDSAFTAAATAANSALSGFDAYANDLFFLHAVFAFEDAGASAYGGALNSISSASYRATAAAIGDAESYHSSLDRTLLYQNLDNVATGSFTVRQITDALVAVLNKLSGSPQLKYALYNQQGASISNVDSNALVPFATPTQILQIVTLGAAKGSGGGFFPNNLNGNIKN